MVEIISLLCFCLQIFADNLRSTLCCLPVVVAAWLCNYVGVSDGETRQKALHLLQLLHSPSSSSASQSTESPLQFYTERSVLAAFDVQIFDK